VHRLRARVDCVLTAIGTVLADDPRLTARGVARVRRVARRIVIDPRLDLPMGCKLLETLTLAPLTIATTSRAAGAKADVARELASRGVEVVIADAVAGGPEEVELREVLSHLARQHDATNVLVEGGPRLMGRLLEQDLADELRVYIGAIALGDELAAPAAAGRSVPALAGARKYELVRSRPLGPDVRLVYRRSPSPRG
jgi:diaminohydroxyphosphoribosylaminopyrimidine deaminase/5-amino-6-(5-phosphoribosylamino)uracil reductase